MKGFFQTQFHKELKEVEFCVKGWNWGEAKFRGSLLSFMVDSKPAFEIPLKEVSQVGWVGVCVNECIGGGVAGCTCRIVKQLHFTHTPIHIHAHSQSGHSWEE